MKGLSRMTAAALAAVVCGVSLLGACGKSDKKDDKKSKNVSKSSVASNDDGSVNSELTSIELVRLMGNGINLGNTMEAYGHGALSPDSDPESFETRWGQPVTTQEIVDGMKALGFDSMRIPVAWTNAMDFESGDYTINSAYLDRVEEIVNYALNDDMYVIINDHWDGGWWGMFGSASEDTRAQAMDMYVSMWTQICDRFENYSDKLIFESANEELGSRLNDTDIAADSGSLSQDECYEKTNEINQKFVDTVRSTGGNNKERFLLIAGFNTDIAMTCDSRFKMPEDTAQDKLLLSVHYYTPWDYCGVESVNHWGSVTDYTEQNRLFKSMSKFTDEGIGVVIGEYAVALKDGEVKNDTDKFISNVLANCDLYDYCPMLWDCSSLYKRSSCTMPDETIANIFKENAYENEIGKSVDEIKQAAQDKIDAAFAAAEEAAAEEEAYVPDDSKAIAWIMYQSSDWAISYSVGDVYNPTQGSDGIVAQDVEITGEGEYTVSLDLSGAGTAKGFVFSALGISNGETLFPGYVIDITNILINGAPVSQVAKEYTSSDDGECTRVNLYNAWVTKLPDDARTADGDLTDCSACILDVDDSFVINNITITFTYKPGV